MATITDLVNSFDPNNKDYDAFLLDLLKFGSDLPFQTEEVNSVQNIIITAINIRTNQASTRYDGLKLLDQILPRCSKDTLTKYGVLWITKATQVVENSNSTVKDLTLACKVIGSLISQCKDIPELQKQISMQNVKQLINAIAVLQTQKLCGAVYYLIAHLLHHYPEACERSQSTIRKLLLLQIDSTDELLVSGTARCYALLAKATERSFKPPSDKSSYSSWTYSQAMICNSLHLIMDEIFADLIELESTDIWHTLELPTICNVNIMQFYSAQKQRFQNLCVYLCTMLRGCGSSNIVLPNDVLKVLCRGLAITPRNLKKRSSFKEQILYLILPTLHTNLLNVLEAFISGFKQELIPYGSKILQLCRQTLEWTGNAIDDQTTISGSKPFKNVRINVYKCLASWLIYTGALSGAETLAHEYLPFILRDIMPERDRVLLTVQKTQNLSKRALKRLRDNQYEKASSPRWSGMVTKNICLDADLCKQGLILLQHIFLSRNCWLKQSFYKNVQNTLIPLLYDYYLGSSEQNFYTQNPECRLELLKTLNALQLNPHYATPPPTQYSVEICELALNDSELRIINEARLALAELEKVVHPSAQTLKLPTQEIPGNNPDTSEDSNMQSDNICENEPENYGNISQFSNKRQKLGADEGDVSSQDEPTRTTAEDQGNSANLHSTSTTHEGSEASESSKLQEEKEPESTCLSQNEEQTIDCRTEQEINKLADLSLDKEEVSHTQDVRETSNLAVNSSTQDVVMTERKNESEKIPDTHQEGSILDDLEQDDVMQLFHDEPKDL